MDTCSIFPRNHVLNVVSTVAFLLLYLTSLSYTGNICFNDKKWQLCFPIARILVISHFFLSFLTNVTTNVIHYRCVLNNTAYPIRKLNFIKRTSKPVNFSEMENLVEFGLISRSIYQKWSAIISTKLNWVQQWLKKKDHLYWASNCSVKHIFLLMQMMYIRKSTFNIWYVNVLLNR